MRRRGLEGDDVADRSKASAEYAARHPRPQATLAQVADHIDHVRMVAGIDHVGIGADYDGTADLPRGLGDVSCYPALVAELFDRGWSEDDCAQLCGGNILRVLREAEVISRTPLSSAAPLQPANNQFLVAI
jgi:membrane dipeptidase